MKTTNTQLSIKILLVLSLIGISLSSYAQQDEPYFQQYYQNRKATGNPLVEESKRNIPVYITTRRNGPCDLVINGGFESQDNIPSRLNNLNGGLSSAPASEPLNQPQGFSDLNSWSSTTGGTPDYYANNAVSPIVVPASALYGGFTPIGQGSIGLFSRRSYSAERNYDQVSEYVSSDISIGTGRYYAQFQVALTRNTNVANYGIANGFGIQLSNGAIPGSVNTNRSFLQQTGVGVLSRQTIGANTVDNWTRISGQFDISSPVNKITLGNFDSQALIPISGRNSNIPNTYIFVDNVEIFKVPTAGPNVSCGQTVGEGCEIPDATYTWTEIGRSTVLSTSLFYTPASALSLKSYVLTVTLPDGSTHATQVSVGGCYDSCNPVLEYEELYLDATAAFLGATLKPVPGAISYNWYRNGVMHQYNHNIACSWRTAKNNCSVGYTIKVEVITNCGTFSRTDYVSPANCISHVLVDKKNNAYVYPNPAQDMIQVDEADEVTIYNSRGISVLNSKNARKTNVGLLPNGIYMVHIKRYGEIVKEKIVVQH